MKQYYYLKDKEPVGPYSFDKLMMENLSSDTYVCAVGMYDWIRLKDLPEYKAFTKFRLPPIPANVSPSDFNIKSDPVVYNDKRSTGDQKYLNDGLPGVLVFWIALHCFALLMSYTGLSYFNLKDRQNTDEFWPFVQFISSRLEIDPNKRHEYDQRSYYHNNMNSVSGGKNYGFMNVTDLTIEVKEFNGLFYQYDYSEFLFFIGIGVLYYIYLKRKNRLNE